MSSGKRKPCAQRLLPPLQRDAGPQEPGRGGPPLASPGPPYLPESCFSRGAASQKGLGLRGDGAHFVQHLGTPFPKGERNLLKILVAVFAPAAFSGCFFLSPFILIYKYPQTTSVKLNLSPIPGQPQDYC